MIANVNVELKTIYGEPIKLAVSEKDYLEIRSTLVDEIAKNPESSINFELELLNRIESAKKPLLLKQVIVDALLLPADSNIEALQNYSLAQRVVFAVDGQVEFSSLEIEKIKKLVARNYCFKEKDESGKEISRPNPTILGQVESLLGAGA
jgi:hypothetical protein